MDELFIKVIAALEQAKDGIEKMRLADRNDAGESKYDGRSLSIAVTNLETAQLWVANAIR